MSLDDLNDQTLDPGTSKAVKKQYYIKIPEKNLFN